jgi:hypothetical protein
MKNPKRLTVLPALLWFSIGLSLPACGQMLSNGSVRITFTEYQGAFRNPMKGLREFFSPGIDHKREGYPYPYGSLIKEYMQWNMLENKADDGIDKIVAYSNHRWAGADAQNVKIIPRVFLVWVEPWHKGEPKDRNNPDDLNGWHWPSDIPGEVAPYKNKKGEFGAYVEKKDSTTTITGGYFDPGFPQRVARLVDKLGKAWDNDSRIAYVEMGIIGEWGEHHDPDISTYWPPHDEPLHVANRTWVPGIEKVLGDAFTKAFKHKKVMVRYAYEFKDYKFGIYWDSWAQPQENVRGWLEMKKLGDRWKTQPIGGEITWNWGDLAKFKSFEEVVADSATRRRVIGQIRDLHCNHLGGITWADFNDPNFKINAASVQKALGYRFVLSEFTYPGAITRDKKFEISFKVTNTGSSPFYYNWPVKVMLLDAKTHKQVWSKQLTGIDISSWMPGDRWDDHLQRYTVAPEVYEIRQTLTVNKNLANGEYIIALAIVDPAGMQPSVRFANTNYFEGGIHPVGYIGWNRTVKTPYLNPETFADLANDHSLRYYLPKSK